MFANGRARTSHLKVVEALSDLYQLLEEYAPKWYTEEHRRKAQTALFPKKIV
jgi:hypothetical protein